MRLFSLKYFLFLLLLFSVFSGLEAQFYNSGQDPVGLKWRQIQTEHFQIIFPHEAESQAQYLANAFNGIYKKVSEGLGINPKKVSVILHNQSTLSNGTTAWAPRRIDLSLVSPQNTYAMNWLDQLAIHEFRHIVQIERINVGITKFLGVLMGEMAVGAAAGSFLPQWYFEGDATDIETLMGVRGRGELPYFKMHLKAQLLEKGLFSYEKATHGSLKDYVPSEYHLGYAISSKVREGYGASVWEKAIDDSGKKPFAITPFSNSLKKNTGFTKQELYRKILSDLKAEWEVENAGLDLSSSILVSGLTATYTDYRYPCFFEDGKILAVKSSFDDVRRIVSINAAGREEVIITPGPGLNQSLSYAHGLICWAEYQRDARWSQRDYSVIKVYDVKAEKLINLTKKSRYFSPLISHDGRQIVCVEVDVKGVSWLKVLDAETGFEIHSFQAPKGLFFSSPSWSSDDSRVVLISMRDGQKRLSLYTLKDQRLEHLIAEGFDQITHPHINGDWVYFTASYSGIDNIYALQLSSNEIYKITGVSYGADDAFVEDNLLLYSSYSANGYELKSHDLRMAVMDVLDNPIAFKNAYVVDKSPYAVKDSSYAIRKYSKSSGLFNFHSWAPFSLDPYNNNVKPGVSFMSQNLLSTAFTTAGYEHDFKEDIGRFYAKFRYEGWYPIIDIDMEHAKRRRYYIADTVNHIIEDFTFKESSIELGLRIPINLSRNRYIRGIQPFASFESIFLKMHPDSPFEFTKNSIQALHYGFSAYHQTMKSRFDIYPKWGQVFQFSYSMTPFVSPGWVGLTTFESVFYFPGLIKHHGLKIYMAYQHRKDGVYAFPNQINHVRGLINKGDVDQYRISADYKLPLAYPDYDLGSFMYLKKIDLGLFYDYGYGWNPELTNEYHTMGLELKSEFHFLSFVAPIDFTLRGLYHPNVQELGLEVIMSIDFSSLY